MFNFQQKKAPMKQVKKEQNKDYAVTILTGGCHFSGKMFCRGSTRVGGKVDGEIISEGLLIIEEEAVVSADIECDEIVLQGKVTGTIKAKQRVEMSRTCDFSGSLQTPSLVVEEGASFTGNSQMGVSRTESLDSGKKGRNSKADPQVGKIETASVAKLSQDEPKVRAEAQ